MIMTAVTALSPNVSNKSAISKYIESEHEDLPAGHSTLLAHHLNKLKESGELLFAKNNYTKPDSNTAIPKRGRGRPPKDKSSVDGSPKSVSRPRGRPPKSKDSLQMATTKASSGVAKRRGRPSKKSSVAADSVDADSSPTKKTTADSVVTASKNTMIGVKRGRGRPPKVKMAVTVGSD